MTICSFQVDDGAGVWEPLREAPENTLWGDLRPSEAIRLSELVSAACDQARDRCVPIILDELTAAWRSPASIPTRHGRPQNR